MAVLSTLRPQLIEHLAQFTKAYAANRPLIQRCLTTGFVLYVLGNTYRGLSARPNGGANSKRVGKGKGKETDGKAPRVAVRASPPATLLCSNSIIIS
jgi:ATP-binding cassette, subfamily D (ALD), peroxisomal long-chain fatty acid import protein